VRHSVILGAPAGVCHPEMRPAPGKGTSTILSS
jgi:hypothetical protein